MPSRSLPTREASSPQPQAIPAAVVAVAAATAAAMVLVVLVAAVGAAGRRRARGRIHLARQHDRLTATRALPDRAAWFGLPTGITCDRSAFASGPPIRSTPKCSAAN